MRFRSLALLSLTLVLAACSGTPTATLPTPPPLQVERTGMITLESIQPEDGISAVTDVIDAARKTVDIAVYQMDPSYSPLLEALTRAKDRGVRVRILLSGTIYPPGSTNDNPRDVEILREQGFEAALSRPEFSFSHWKVLIIDAGTEDAQALICDFNLEAGYFGLDPQSPTRAIRAAWRCSIPIPRTST
jgi:phosphatidylserine/phosphatidylglycerophosphate/cardiolipin synthase-like enzyme